VYGGWLGVTKKRAFELGIRDSHLWQAATPPTTTPIKKANATKRKPLICMARWGSNWFLLNFLEACHSEYVTKNLGGGLTNFRLRPEIPLRAASQAAWSKRIRVCRTGFTFQSYSV